MFDSHSRKFVESVNQLLSGSIRKCIHNLLLNKSPFHRFSTINFRKWIAVLSHWRFEHGTQNDWKNSRAFCEQYQWRQFLFRKIWKSRLFYVKDNGTAELFPKDSFAQIQYWSSKSVSCIFCHVENNLFYSHVQLFATCEAFAHWLSIFGHEVTKNQSSPQQQLVPASATDFTNLISALFDQTVPIFFEIGVLNIELTVHVNICLPGSQHSLWIKQWPAKIIAYHN